MRSSKTIMKDDARKKNFEPAYVRQLLVWVVAISGTKQCIEVHAHEASESTNHFHRMETLR